MTYSAVYAIIISHNGECLQDMCGRAMRVNIYILSDSDVYIIRRSNIFFTI